MTTKSISDQTYYIGDSSKSFSMTAWDNTESTECPIIYTLNSVPTAI